MLSRAFQCLPPIRPSRINPSNTIAHQHHPQHLYSSPRAAVTATTYQLQHKYQQQQQQQRQLTSTPIRSSCRLSLSCIPRRCLSSTISSNLSPQPPSPPSPPNKPPSTLSTSTFDEFAHSATLVKKTAQSEPTQIYQHSASCSPDGLGM